MNITRHRSGETARDGKPQARAALPPAHGRLGLLELEEQERQCLLVDADAGILDRNRDAHFVGFGAPSPVPLAARVTVTSTPPLSVNLMALPTRLVRICRSRTSSPSSRIGRRGSIAQAMSMPFS